MSPANKCRVSKTNQCMYSSSTMCTNKLAKSASLLYSNNKSVSDYRIPPKLFSNRTGPAQ